MRALPAVVAGLLCIIASALGDSVLDGPYDPRNPIALQQAKYEWADPKIGPQRLEALQLLAPADLSEGEEPIVPTEGIVTANGTNFMLNGKPFYVAGSNHWELTVQEWFTEESMDALMRGQALAGANVLRVFAFSENGAENLDPFQLKYSREGDGFNEDAFEHLDSVMALAGKYGLRIILTLTNWWPTLGGVRWYVNNEFWPGANTAWFYQSPNIKQVYKNYVEKLVTRTNTVNGIKYSEDPAIFAWELCNECQTNWDYENRRGMEPGKLVRDWTWEMAAFIKSMDPNHMVTNGGEGYMIDDAPEPSTWPWLWWQHSGAKGEDFRGNIASPNIDFATVHAYPLPWGLPASNLTWMNVNWLRIRAKVALAENKPIILEEVGVKTNDYKDYGGRESYFSHIFAWTHKWGYAGSLVWLVYPQLTYDDPNNLAFAYDQDGGKAVKDLYEYTHDLNQGSCTQLYFPEEICLDVASPSSPENAPTCPEQLEAGLCDDAFNIGYCMASCGHCQWLRYSHLDTAGVELNPPPAYNTPPANWTEPTPPDGLCADVSPSVYMCSLHAYWGQCKESWMQGFCNWSCKRCPAPTSPSPSPAPPPPCTDINPAGMTCEQVANTDTCPEVGLGYCDLTCGRCCLDIAPPWDTEGCAQRAEWGQCNEDWMQGFCLVTCGQCVDGCYNTPIPYSPHSCADQASWGKCEETFMMSNKGYMYCDLSCGRCANSPSPQLPSPSPQLPSPSTQPPSPSTQCTENALRVDNLANPPTLDYSVQVPDGYEGFQYTGVWALLGARFPSSGYANGVVSGTNVMLNYQSQVATISSPTEFVPVQVYATSAWHPRVEATFQVFNGATLIETVVVELNMDAPTLVQFTPQSATSVTWVATDVITFTPGESKKNVALDAFSFCV